MVRLIANETVHKDNFILNFNSSMVRLIALTVDVAILLASAFQFQYGTVDR